MEGEFSVRPVLVTAVLKEALIKSSPMTLRSAPMKATLSRLCEEIYTDSQAPYLDCFLSGALKPAAAAATYILISECQNSRLMREVDLQHSTASAISVSIPFGLAATQYFTLV